MILEVLHNLDLAVLRFFNVDFIFWHSDQIWGAISHLEKQKWFILGFLPAILIFLFLRYGVHALKVIVGVGLAAVVSDLISYRVIKHFVVRPRPFENVSLTWLRHVGEAHGPSFPSNHAANCFAGAVILAFFFPELSLLFYLFATLVAISRVALGVHYPSDVFAGAVLGFFVGFFIKIFIFHSNSYLQNRLDASESNAKSSGWRTRIRRRN